MFKVAKQQQTYPILENRTLNTGRTYLHISDPIKKSFL